MSGTGIFSILNQWLLYVPPALTLRRSAFCVHSVFVFRMILTGIILLNWINWFVFVMETQRVSCEVGTGFLNTLEERFSNGGLQEMARCAPNIIKVYFENEKKPICIEIFIHGLKYINIFLILYTKRTRKFVYV
jgi:hypothetical protein